MATDRKATNIWTGDLKSGSGEVSFDSTGAAGPLQVSWPARAEEPGDDTSPEELIAAAHASCFNMAFSNQLAQAGSAPERLETSAVVTFSLDGGPHIAKVALTVRGSVPDLDADTFVEKAEAAKDGCPVSKALAGNVEITVDATLE